MVVVRQIKSEGQPPAKKIKTTISVQMEERLAARASGYTWLEYQGLAGAPWWADGKDSKAEVLVYYREYIKLDELRYG